MTTLLSNLLTNSRMKCVRQCPRLHFFKYLLGYRPNADKAELFFGSLMHKGLEAWWLAVMAGLPELEWFNRAIAALISVAGVDPFDLAKAQVLMKGYHSTWAGDVGEYEILGVEQRFEFALTNPATGRASPVWRVAGKLDVRIRRKKDGLVGFIEHKTSSEDVSLGSPYWQVLKMDSQVSTYFDGASSLGDEAAFCLYDVIGKPGQKPGSVPLTDELGNKIVLDAKGERVRTGQGKWRQTSDTAQGYVLQTRDETPDEYGLRCLAALEADPAKFYTRGEVVRLEAELNEARAENWQLAAMLRESINAERYPRNVDSCRRGNSLCAFFGVCTKVVQLDDLRLFTRSDLVHPELEPTPVSGEEQSTQGAA